MMLSKVSLACLFASLAIGFTSCKSKEEIELERKALEIEQQKLDILTQQANEIRAQQANEVAVLIPSASQWETLQMAHFEEKRAISTSWEALMFEAPPYAGPLRFEESDSGLAAVMRLAVGSCPIGAVWYVKAEIQGNEVKFTRGSSDPACDSLFPEFAKASRF